MVEIKELYEKTYKTTLAEDIKKHHTDVVQNVLLALIKGTFPVLPIICICSRDSFIIKCV